MTLLGKTAEKYTDLFYFVFRIFVGLLFAQHGAQKLFGWFPISGVALQPVDLFSLMGLAGLVEFVGGLFIALGLFTRLAALLGAVQMAAAYFMAHFPQGWVPIQNMGELALLYFAAFLVILVLGGKKWALESALAKEELF